MTSPEDTQPGRARRATPEPPPLSPSDTQPHRRGVPPPPPPPPPPTVFAPTKPSPLPHIPATPESGRIFATPAPEPPPAINVSGRVGGDVIGGDRNETNTAGRDLAGRDVVTNTTTTTTNNTNVGFSAAAVQRLVLSVGMLVFVTAACFFSGGIVLGGATFAALAKVVPSSPALAAQFAEILAGMQNVPPGQQASFDFTEAQLNAYFHEIVAPTLPLNITDGQVRLVSERQIVIGGRAGTLANAHFAATFDWQDTPGAPLRLTGAAVQTLPLGHSVFGWIAVPTPVLQPLTGGINNLFGGIALTNVQDQPGDTWTVTVVGQ